jgi:protein-S-isoprenylcysteine O-methyltransferase Ste14
VKPATTLASILFALVSLLHLLRLVFKVEVTVGGNVIPMWVSVLGCLVSGGVALAVWRENRTR